MTDVGAENVIKIVLTAEKNVSMKKMRSLTNYETEKIRDFLIHKAKLFRTNKTNTNLGSRRNCHKMRRSYESVNCR